MPAEFNSPGGFGKTHTSSLPESKSAVVNSSLLNNSYETKIPTLSPQTGRITTSIMNRRANRRVCTPMTGRRPHGFCTPKTRPENCRPSICKLPALILRPPIRRLPPAPGSLSWTSVQTQKRPDPGPMETGNARQGVRTSSGNCPFWKRARSIFCVFWEKGTACTNIFLRRLQNFAVDMSWLPWPVLPKKRWPVIKPKRSVASLGMSIRKFWRVNSIPNCTPTTKCSGTWVARKRTWHRCAPRMLTGQARPFRMRA